jgi:hypothetical protein
MDQASFTITCRKTSHIILHQSIQSQLSKEIGLSNFTFDFHFRTPGCSTNSTKMTDQNDALDALPEETLTAEEELNSAKVSLADLCAKGTAQYAHKNYEEAADTYARASELQAELNGEMSPENAEVLFLYGRSLFKVGQSKSDVLGGRAGGEKKKPSSNTKVKKEESKIVDAVAQEGVAIIAEQKTTVAPAAEVAKDVASGNKPLFQFTGDENFEDSDDDEEVCFEL